MEVSLLSRTRLDRQERGAVSTAVVRRSAEAHLQVCDTVLLLAAPVAAETAQQDLSYSTVQDLVACRSRMIMSKAVLEVARTLCELRICISVPGLTEMIRCCSPSSAHNW